MLSTDTKEVASILINSFYYIEKFRRLWAAAFVNVAVHFNKWGIWEEMFFLYSTKIVKMIKK